MRLIEYMREQKLDDETFAKRVGCGPYAVKKWKYRERQPPADKVIRIEAVTGGLVGLADLVLSKSDRRKARQTPRPRPQRNGATRPTA